MNPDTDPNNTPPVEGSTPTPTPAPDATPAVPATPSPVPSNEQVPTAPTESLAVAPAPDTAPADPAAPIASAAPVAEPLAAPVAPAPKNKNTKKIILIASIVGGLVILGTIAAILFTLFTSVSKEDYRDAAVQFNEVGRSSATLTSSASTLSRSANASAPEATFQESLKSSQEAIAKIEAENEEFSKLKAVRVGEGAELYKAFDAKVDAYLAYVKGVITSVENLRPAMVVCGNLSDARDVPARAAALKTCSAALGDVKDIPNPAFKKFADELKTSYASYAKTYEEIAALANPLGADYEEYKKLRDSTYDSQDKINDATKEFSASITASNNELSVKDSANALGDYLTAQQRK